MASYDPVDNDKFLLDLLTEHVKVELRKRLEPIAKAQLDDAIEKAVKSMEVSIHSSYSMMNTEKMVKVILEKKK